MGDEMKIGMLGTGVVGRTVAGKLAELGHGVFVGTRDPEATLARTDPDSFGNPPFKVWHEEHPDIGLGTHAAAAAYGALLVNATSGAGTLPALESAGAEDLAGKVLIDLANPLDFSKGMPPTLSVCNTDSLAEQIQKRFPELKVVKTLNTVSAHVMIGPGQLADSDHTMFLCGDDEDAKKTVTGILQSFGWKDILDVGDITGARGLEMYLPIWLRLWQATGVPMFNVKVVR